MLHLVERKEDFADNCFYLISCDVHRKNCFLITKQYRLGKGYPLSHPIPKLSKQSNLSINFCGICFGLLDPIMFFFK
ncbi:hypothetical protein HOLleu_07350 [Holothuria leucospilota]|uniref:Uncharacterized protein n=1 Tax=Holothuria leucospilota TaxID=206669 RepID=A0A9Q1CFV3_HOLLE|nr:hypothetical protein HOLleu_07350 [Holothuria leucospilota]